jgi:hypothetical protein
MRLWKVASPLDRRTKTQLRAQSFRIMRSTLIGCSLFEKRIL